MRLTKLNEDARNEIKKGIDLVADAVKATIGPEGRNAIIDRRPLNPIITNDGVTIAMHIESENEFENLGIQVMQETSAKTNDEVGDGTTTSTIIAQAIINKGYKILDPNNITGNKSIVFLKNEIQTTCDKVVEELKKISKPVNDEIGILQVAETSMENKTVAKLITEVVNKVGKDGVITIEDSHEFNVSYELVEGAKLEAGYASPFLITNNKRETILETPYVLITKERVDSINQIKKIIDDLVAKKANRLVIIAKDFSQELLNMFVINKARGAFLFLPIKSTGLPQPDEKIEDIAILTGAKVFDNEDSISDAVLAELGQADKVISKHNESYIVGGKGKVKEKIEELKIEMKGCSKYKLESLKKRIANLSGGIAVIKVGANSEVEREYTKHKVEDTVNAAKAALEEGVVKGGGLALKEICEKLKLDDDNLLKEALVAPYNQIQENAGGKLKIGANIIDPTKVVRVALENACSVAKTLLTTSTAIAIKNEEDKD